MSMIGEAIKNDESKAVSMGRILALSLFVVITGYLFFAKWQANGGDIGPNDAMVVQWGYLTAILGKGAQKAAEMIGKKK